MAWYGYAWAEIYNDTPLKQAAGYSESAWTIGHQRLIDIAKTHAGPDLAIEFSLSGHWGGNPMLANDLTDHMVNLWGSWSDQVYVQGNGLGLYNNKSTNRAVHTAKQMYDDRTWDWPSIYRILNDQDEQYVEVYLNNFTNPEPAHPSTQLQHQQLHTHHHASTTHHTSTNHHTSTHPSAVACWFSTLELKVTGVTGVPSTADAVVLNMTAVNVRAPGFATVYPCGEPRPEASNLNYTAGQTIPNLVIAKPGAGGKVCIYSYATIDALADVSGYFPAGSGFTPIANPARILDTRNGTGTRCRCVLVRRWSCR